MALADFPSIVAPLTIIFWFYLEADARLHEHLMLGHKRVCAAIERRQEVGADGAAQFYRRANHASAIVNKKIYIDGGEYSYMMGGTMHFTYEPNTLVLDLSRSWSPGNVSFGVIPKPSGVPILNSPTLWYYAAQNTLLQGFGGSASSWPNTTFAYDLGLWSLKLDSAGAAVGTWSEVFDARHPAFGALTRPFFGAAAHDGNSSAFVLGGYSTGQTTPALAGNGRVLLPGLVSYNMASRDFYNASATGYYGTGMAQRAQMLHVPAYGTRGLYVVLGGDNARASSNYAPGKSLVSFANVTLYNPADRRWYWQTATGEVPKGRIEFCAAGAMSTNGTYEIFVYGGWGGVLGDTAVAYDEMHILSLPSFQWFRVRYPARRPRHGHTCHIVPGQRQLISLGGADPTPSRAYAAPRNNITLATFATRDEFPQGIGVFDITALNFSASYDAHAAPYEQSAPVAKYYSEYEGVPATWDMPELKAIIDPVAITDRTIATGGLRTKGRDARRPLSVSAIAGIVVGGVVLLALLGILVTCLVRRRRRRQQQHATEGSERTSLAGRDAWELDAKNPHTELPATSAAGPSSSTSVHKFGGFDSPPLVGSQCPTIHEMGE